MDPIDADHTPWQQGAARELAATTARTLAQSPEYPDLAWRPPASWTDANRTSVQLIVIHTTEGSEGPTSAEDGAAYDARRTDGTSTHFFHDSNTTVQCVRTADIAHAARRQGNLRGIQHELCGRAGQGLTGWADATSQGTVAQAAKQCARDARKWNIPVRHLTVAQVADGTKGFCGHWDITRAFPQDQGTHTDPGPTFGWTQFLDMVRAQMGDGMRDLEFQHVDAQLPILKYGDSDGQYRNSQTGWVGRLQRALGVPDDGDYGPVTKAAVLALGVPGMTGATVDLRVWEQIYGLWGAVDRLDVPA